MLFFGHLDAAKGWTKQLHLGAYRNPNTRALKTLGRDTGFDAIGDWPHAEAFARYLDRLDQDVHVGTAHHLAHPVALFLAEHDNTVENGPLTVRVLSREGFEVLTATNGREGLETAAKYRPDLIILDLNLPDV